MGEGQGSTVGEVIDGSLHGYRRTGIAGVSNVGSDTSWTGSQFNQANWYAFGRLAWDHDLTASAVADEWIRMTFTNDQRAVASIRSMMMTSREAVVSYMTPLGLAHIMATGHHYGPGAWANGGRADWTPSYYHRADSLGIGFDRTASGSNAVAQYFPPVRDRYASRATVPDSVLLVPSCALDRPARLGAHGLGRARASLQRRCRLGPRHADHMERRAKLRGLGAVRGSGVVSRHSGARSEVVA
jgi:alpha-glucuronidase